MSSIPPSAPASSARRLLKDILLALLALAGLALPSIAERTVPRRETAWSALENARLEREGRKVARAADEAARDLEAAADRASHEPRLGGDTAEPEDTRRAFEALASAAVASGRTLPGLGLVLESEGSEIAWWGRPLVRAGEEPAGEEGRDAAFILGGRTRPVVAVGRSLSGGARIIASAPLDLGAGLPAGTTARLASTGEPAGDGAAGHGEAGGGRSADEGARPLATVPIALESLAPQSHEPARVVIEGETREGAVARRRVLGEQARFFVLAIVAALAALRARTSAAAGRLGSGGRLSLWLGLVWATRLLLALVRPSIGPGAWGLFRPDAFAGSAPLGLLRSPADLLLTVAALAATVWFADRLLGRDPVARVASAPARLALRLVLVATIPLAWSWGTRSVAAATYAAGPRLFDAPLPPMSPEAIVLIVALALSGFMLYRVLALLVRASGLAAHLPALAVTVLAAAAVPLLARLPALAPLADLLPAAPILAVTLAAAGVLAHLGREEPPLELGRSALLLLGASLVLLPGVSRGLEARDRERIQATAARFATPRDEWRRFVLEETLAFFAERRTLVEALTPGVPEDSGNLAYSEWAESPLATLGYECALEILNGAGAVVSRFSVGIPSESGYRATFAFRDARETKRPVIVGGKRRIGRDDVDTYLGAVPVLSDAGTVVGAVVVTIPYFFENLAFATRPGAHRPLVLGAGAAGTNPSAEIEGRLVVSRFERGRLTASSDPTIQPGLALPGELAATPAGRFWHGSLYGRRGTTLLAPLPEGAALAFTLVDGGLAGLAAHLVHIALVGAVILLCRALAVLGRDLLARRPRPASFREKLLAAFLVIAVIPAVLMGILTQRSTTQRLAGEARREAAQGLDAVRALLRERSLGEATHLSESTLIRRLTLGLEPPTSIDLETGLKKFCVFDAGGQLLLQNGVVPEVRRDLVRRVAATLSPETFFSPEDGLSVVSLVPVVFEGERDPGKGALLLRTPVDGSLLAELGAEGNRDLIAYGKGGLVATNRPELFQSELLPNRMPAEDYIDCFLNRKEAVYGMGTLAGVPYVVAYGALPGLSGETLGALAVPLLFRQREISEDLGRSLASILYLTVLVLVAVSFLATLVADRIARPVAELSAGTARAARGDLAFSLRRTTGGELGQLVDSFNRMTEELRKSRDRILERTRTIEAILGNMTTGVLALDREGRITTLNRGGARILGLPVDAAIGRPASWLRDGAHDAIADTLGAIGSAPGGVLEREIALPRARGTARAARAAAHGESAGPGVEPFLSVRAVGTRLLNEEGEEMGRVLVFEDLTELIRSKKLLAWSEMARQVAHEIKNPLTPMKLSAQHIRKAHRDAAPGFSRILEEGTQAIIDQVESLRRIATEFSQFARMPRRLVREQDLNEIVRESARFYGREAAVALELDLAPAGPRARVDREEMKRVFLNLIENAVQASETGGLVRVRTLEVPNDAKPARPDDAAGESAASFLDDAAPPGGFAAWSRPPARAPLAVILFEDEGSGIAAEFRERLFEPNFSTKTNGTGLGLAICKGIVEESGGAIRVASAVGRGTTVAVVLPGARA